jgi:hypothetical protein
MHKIGCLIIILCRQSLKIIILKKRHLKVLIRKSQQDNQML